MRFSDELCRRSKFCRKIRSMRRKNIANKVTSREPQIISKSTYLEEKNNIKNNNNKDYIESCIINKDSDDEYEIIEIEIKPHKIVCPDCGGITLEGLEFCHKCGSELDVNL